MYHGIKVSKLPFYFDTLLADCLHSYQIESLCILRSNIRENSRKSKYSEIEYLSASLYQLSIIVVEKFSKDLDRIKASQENNYDL